MTFLKSIVAGLVLANLAYFLWARGVASNAQATAQAPAIATLKLASEAALPVPEAPATTPPATSPPLAAPAAMAAAPAPVAAPSATDPAADTPATAGFAPVRVDRASTAGSGAGAVPGTQRCVTVGPFRDVAEAALAATTLRGDGHDPRQRVADGDVWAGVWVYLPLPASPAASDQVMTQLKAGGIDDALEMPGPADGSVISLGLYSESKRAQARVAQAQALGFEPAVADRKRTGNVYWIDVDLKPGDGPLNTADLQSEKGRIVRLEVKSCPPPAGAAP